MMRTLLTLALTGMIGFLPVNASAQISETNIIEIREQAEQGDAEAQFNLGLMYDHGRRVTQDYAEAIHWYRMAAEQGLAVPQFNLGAMYARGRGITQDYSTAHMWFNISAANGFGVANEARDEMASFMTTADISEAQRRARVCMESGYTNCD